jgi:hypothetical protein
MNRRPKQISVPIETGEENVSEKRVREAQFWALGFSGNRRTGYAVENLAGGLKTETVRYKLSVAREFKMEIPVKTGVEAAFEGRPKFLESSLALLSGYLQSSCSARAERLAISLFIGYKAYASAKKTLYDDGHRRPRGAAD